MLYLLVISPSNINIASGLAGRLLTNKVYGALSWTGCACDCFEWMAGFGGSYEFVVNHDQCNALKIGQCLQNGRLDFNG